MNCHNLGQIVQPSSSHNWGETRVQAKIKSLNLSFPSRFSWFTYRSVIFKSKLSRREFFKKWTNEFVFTSKYATCFCSFFWRNWRLQKGILKLSDLLLNPKPTFGQFKVQNTTNINHNKTSLLKELSNMSFVYSLVFVQQNFLECIRFQTIFHFRWTA